MSGFISMSEAVESGRYQWTLDLEERVLRCVEEEPKLVQGLQPWTVSQNKAVQMLHTQILYL
jgi:hypothetical protein